MKQQEKHDLFKEWQVASNLNTCKDKMYEAVQFLEEHNMHKDAEQLMNMIYRLEAFQNKY